MPEHTTRAQAASFLLLPLVTAFWYLFLAVFLGLLLVPLSLIEFVTEARSAWRDGLRR